MDISSRKRPWLAAALAFPVTGLGHLYLRRWRRAAGWLLLVAAAAVVLAPGVESPSVLVGASFQAVPLFVLVWLSALDAYMVAYRQNLVGDIDSERRCSRCYRTQGMDIGFCEWCGDEVSGADLRDGRR
ncbi:zinc ribbon domain-containing protein [Halalkalicoccus tibetensis]|uniref:Zinc ribbon domain-containing protein n=1 Tax=Halalkalicoccus tibetensis TaxID=175632 RepID=A0ABD5UY00_9EURY